MKKYNWKSILNSESSGSFWEITNNTKDNTITLHYVPEENYSDKDVKIIVPYDQFKDLIKFMKSMKNKKAS